MTGADASLDGVEGSADTPTPVWAVFGDLMAGLLGAFVLILVGVLAVQWHLSRSLEEEIALREQEQQRRLALEQALAGPLASGRVTLQDGRIGISGSVLFALNSAQLQPEGQTLLESLAGPLAAYLATRDDLLMVSGFTDNKRVRETNRRFDDNWDLSAQRALTVTRALITAGVPSSSLFAAAFGEEQPVASNDEADGRARNRRVEMAPVPRGRRQAAVGAGAGAVGASAAGAAAVAASAALGASAAPAATTTPAASAVAAATASAARPASPGLPSSSATSAASASR